MEVNYIPSQAKGESPLFSGSILLKAPTFDQRFEYLEISGFQPEMDGTVESRMSQLKAIRKSVQLSKPHYISVNIKHLETGDEFKSFEEMTMNPVCDTILMEIGALMVGGIRPGKN
jgi:hypothetical protein